jgi:hypothetical protein
MGNIILDDRKAPPLPRSKVAFEVAVMVRAHEKWVAAGCPKSKQDRFWADAEEELLESHSL